MDTVWKYPLNKPDMQGRFDVPAIEGAEILHVGFDPSGQLSAWVRVSDPVNKGNEELSIAVVGTGNPIPEGFTRFVNTFIEGSFVFHVFVKETS